MLSTDCQFKNAQQETATLLLYKFLNNRQKVFLLEGIPGSGKTHTVSNFLKNQHDIPYCNIIILTPTHQAKKVIAEKTGGKFECSTIHSFLGFTKQIDKNGDTFFKITEKKDSGSSIKVVVVDECSMVNKKCFEALMKIRNKKDFKLIFLGDKNQLPPIGENVSLSFGVDKEDRYKLTENVRNSNDIFKLTTYILQNIRKKCDFFTESTKNITVYKNVIEYHEKLKQVVKETDKINQVKILCWTNNKRKNMNVYVRKLKYGDSPQKYYVGEELISMSMLMSVDGQTQLATNDMFEIEGLEKEMINVDKSEHIPKRFKKYFEEMPEFEVWKISNTDFYIYDMVDKYVKKFNRIMEMIYDECYEYKKKDFWEQYYRLKEIFLPEVDYTYALTVHRSQGSEWDIIFLDSSNINRNRKMLEKNKLIYVGASRSKTKLYVLK